MELTLSDDQQFFCDTTRRFLSTECPISRVRTLASADAGFEPGYWRQGGELGWTSLLVPESAGGGSVSGSGVIDLTIVADAFGRHVAPGPLLPTNIVAATLGRDGSGAHADVLAGLLAGEAVATWCGAEHALGDGATRATRTADGYRLSGVSTPVEAAAQSQSLLVTARLDGDVVAEGGLGPLVQFLLPTGTDGVTVEPLAALDVVRRFARVEFADVRVPAAAVVSGDAPVADDVEQQLLHALVIQAATLVGAAERVFDFTVEWAFDRYSFGRPLASYQALKHRFADMKMWLEVSHALTSALAREVQDGAEGVHETASVTKAYVGHHLTELLHDCIQMHGGIGLTTDHDLHLYLRRVVTERSSFGTPADHRRRVAVLAAGAAA